MTVDELHESQTLLLNLLTQLADVSLGLLNTPKRTRAVGSVLLTAAFVPVDCQLSRLYNCHRL